jgi:hypothetical protein
MREEHEVLSKDIAHLLLSCPRFSEEEAKAQLRKEYFSNEVQRTLAQKFSHDGMFYMERTCILSQVQRLCRIRRALTRNITDEAALVAAL